MERAGSVFFYRPIKGETELGIDGDLSLCLDREERLAFAHADLEIAGRVKQRKKLVDSFRTGNHKGSPFIVRWFCLKFKKALNGQRQKRQAELPVSSWP